MRDIQVNRQINMERDNIHKEYLRINPFLTFSIMVSSATTSGNKILLPFLVSRLVPIVGRRFRD